MNIRKVTEDDAQAFLEMLNRLDNETKHMMYEPGERPQDINRMIDRIKSVAENGDLLLSTFLDDELVGFISANKGSFHRGRHCAYLVIGILKKGQGKGLGSLLFEHMLEWAKEQCLVRLELTVMCHNEGGLALYRKYGFEIEGVKRKSLKVDSTYVDEYYMSKILEW